MKKILFIMLVFAWITNAQSDSLFQTTNSPPDTLIEPGKENPADEVIPPDSILPEAPQPPDTLEEREPVSENEDDEVTYAFAEVLPTAGNSGSGRITFSKLENGIKVTGVISGLTPGYHGIHIHEKGDCSAPDASSAGGHFNPDQMIHGSPDNMQRHTGDFGNIEADDNGTARIDFFDTKISFEGMHSIIGKAIVIHAGRDDLKTQPSGDSGGRVLCGVIEQSNNK